MPSVHPLTRDALAVTLGAGPRDRLSLRRGALEMLLDPPRLFLASAEQARRLLRGETGALALVEATDADASPAPPADPDAAERKRREASERLRALVEKRLPPRPPAEEEP